MLNNYYDRINNLDIVQTIRAEKAEAERKAAEEEAKRKQEEAERAAKLKLERIEAAEKAIENIISYGISGEEMNKLLDTAYSKVGACEEYSEYKRLKEELDELDKLYRINISNGIDPESE